MARPEELAGLTPGPLSLGQVPAGWPSPAQDYVEEQLNLHSHVVKNPASTFFMYAAGDSMTGAGIYDGDLLVVDRSVSPRSGQVVIARLDGELTVKYYEPRKGRVWLVPGNPAYPARDVTDFQEAPIWGVVTCVLHKPLPRDGTAPRTQAAKGGGHGSR